MYTSGTKIRFTITVDETVTDLTVSDICQAVERFAQNYNQCFVEKFQGTDPLPLDCVVLGGGSGFVSKTIIYPMFGEKEGVRKARVYSLKQLQAGIQNMLRI